MCGILLYYYYSSIREEQTKIAKVLLLFLLASWKNPDFNRNKKFKVKYPSDHCNILPRFEIHPNIAGHAPVDFVMSAPAFDRTVYARKSQESRSTNRLEARIVWCTVTICEGSLATESGLFFSFFPLATYFCSISYLLYNIRSYVHKVNLFTPKPFFNKSLCQILYYYDKARQFSGSTSA